MKKNFTESVVYKTNPLYTKKNASYIVRKQYLDHEKDVFSDDIGVWVKSKTKTKSNKTSGNGKMNLKKYQETNSNFMKNELKQLVIYIT